MNDVDIEFYFNSEMCLVMNIFCRTEENVSDFLIGCNLCQQ